MNRKRILIALVIGIICGIFCAMGSAGVTNPLTGEAFGIFILASIFYNRVLIGVGVGFADSIKLHPVLRGALVGIVVGFAGSIAAFEGGLYGGAILLVFSVIYGIIADVVATHFSK